MMPHSRPPRALDPLPVGALVGERLVARPALEARPSLRAVRARRAAGGQEVLYDRALAVRVVVGTVAQRHRHSVRAPGTSAMEAAAEELEGAHVDVGVDEAAHARLRVGSLERRPGDVHLHLGEGRAALGGRERPAGFGRGDLDESAQRPHAEVPPGPHVRKAQRAAVVGDSPVRRRARGGESPRAGRARRRSACARPGRRAGSCRGRWPAGGRVWRRPRSGPSRHTRARPARRSGRCSRRGGRSSRSRRRRCRRRRRPERTARRRTRTRQA